MGLPIKGLLKGLRAAGKTTKVIAESNNPIKVYKEVSKVTKPIFDAVLPKGIPSTAKEATGPRRLLKYLVPKDITKTVIPIPKPPTETERLASTIKRFKQTYPKGLNSPRGNTKRNIALIGASATAGVLITKNRK